MKNNGDHGLGTGNNSDQGLCFVKNGDRGLGAGDTSLCKRYAVKQYLHWWGVDQTGSLNL